MATQPPGFPPTQAPPAVPPGWRADWSSQYNTWFYVNLTTQATQWEFPMPPAQQPYPPPANYDTPPPLQQSPPPLQQPDAGAVPGDPQADGDKGIGKAGLLAAAGGLLAGAFVAHEVDEHNEHKSKFSIFNAGKLATAAGAGGLGGGLLSSVGSHLPFGRGGSGGGGGNVYPPQPQPQGGGGLASYMPFANSNAPRLNIICAAFCDQDVTQQVRRMVTPDQKFEINTDGDGLVKNFGNPWLDKRKQFSILYSYGQRPWELVAAKEGMGPFSLVPHQPLDSNRMAFIKQGRVVAVVWGVENGLKQGEMEKLKQIETTGEFQATNDWFGFDGMWPDTKTAIVYYRAGNEIRFAHAREGGTVRLPWNPLARWN